MFTVPSAAKAGVAAAASIEARVMFFTIFIFIDIGFSDLTMQNY
jgi:hypothetical protein